MEAPTGFEPATFEVSTLDTLTAELWDHHWIYI